MKKIAIFVEGQTERIFMLRFLNEYLGENKIEIRMEKRLGNRGVKYLGMRKNPYAEFYILVYDVGGDGNVVSAVKDMIILLRGLKTYSVFLTKNTKKRKSNLIK